MGQTIQVDLPQGVVSDPPAREVAPELWTSANNVQFLDGKTRKRGGQAKTLFTYTAATADPSPANTGGGTIGNIDTGPSTVAEVITVTCTAVSSPAGSETWSVVGSVSGSIGTATTGVTFSTPEVEFLISADASSPFTDFIVGDNFTITWTEQDAADDIHWMQSWRIPAADYWVWASKTKLYRWDGTNHVNVTRQTGSPPADSNYSATDDVRWNGGVFGDVLIANNGNDQPQYMDTTMSDFADFPTGGSVNWKGNGGGATLTCKAMRMFKSYLVALNLNDSSLAVSAKPQTLRWSSSADPGSLPNWDITVTTNEAGEVTLAETDGQILDGLALGDSFMIYKDDSVWGMQLVGGQYVMRFYKVFHDAGIIGTDCVAAFEGQHFVVSSNDVYIHNGTSKKSVIDGKVKDQFFARIDDSKLDRAYVVADYRNREMLFCYCKSNGSSTHPDEAMVYNWSTGTISYRDLPGSAHIGFGEILDSPEEAETWAQDIQNWDEDNTAWGENTGKITERRLLIPDTTGQAFYAEGRADTDGGTNYKAFVQRVGLQGNDPVNVKHIYRVIPTIEGTGTIDIRVGGEMTPGAGIVWKGPFTYTIGTDWKVDCRGVRGRSIAIEFSSENANTWNLHSYTLEGEISGQR